MRSIVLPDYNTNIIRAIRSLEVQERPVPEPAEGEVLIKLEAAPINPSDIAFIRGGYNIRKPVPTVPGFEGTGKVVASGGGKFADDLEGKRVSCFSQGEEDGTWAEYIVVAADSCIEIREDLPPEQAGVLCVNPFTAYALFQFVRGKDAMAFIQNAAAGQVGRFLGNLARRERIDTIHIVRKKEHVDELKAGGEKHVLCSTDEDFTDKLEELSSKLMPTVAFDAVSGKISGEMFNAMPAGSDLVTYGALSGEPISKIDPMDIIFKNKIIRGFNLNDWKEAAGERKYHELTERIQKLVMEGLLSTRIRKIYPMKDVQAALMDYIRDMSAGKAILKPDPA